MSFITYQVQCENCGKTYNTAFGIVGMTQIAAPLEKCPECGGAVKKARDEWNMTVPSLCIHCDCHGHHLEAVYGGEEDLLYLSIEVKPRGFWAGLREAWKLFNGVRKGCYEEVILNKESRDKLYGYLRQITNSREWKKDRG